MFSLIEHDMDANGATYYIPKSTMSSKKTFETGCEMPFRSMSEAPDVVSPDEVPPGVPPQMA